MGDRSDRSGNRGVGAVDNGASGDRGSGYLRSGDRGRSFCSFVGAGHVDLVGVDLRKGS